MADAYECCAIPVLAEGSGTHNYTKTLNSPGMRARRRLQPTQLAAVLVSPSAAVTVMLPRKRMTKSNFNSSVSTR